MKNALLILCAVLGIGAVAMDADAARRLGGGSNVGQQRQMIQPAPKAPAQAPSAAPAAPAQQPQPSGMSRWLGPLAGLALGAGLASMFMHGGFGSVLMVLLIVAAVILVMRMLRPKPREEPLQYAGASAPVGGGDISTSFGSGSSAEPAPSPYPAGFDAEQFVRHAKINFTRLQAAHDQRAMSTMRDFMTPQLYAEIAAQVDARGSEPQKTDVVTLDARVLEVVTEDDHYIASVQFSGMLREASDAQAEPFSEIWHLEKPVNGNSGWLIAGIQQA
jgi:predicted lipid-binding transport protein (Tim44 family)